MFQLSIPQPAMLHSGDLKTMMEAQNAGMDRSQMQKLAEIIRETLNPHPANQKTENVPRFQGKELDGMQHKYRETVLFFPSEVCQSTRHSGFAWLTDRKGQYCHAFCTYCFRWAQFTSVGSSQTFKSSNGSQLQEYIHSQPQVKDVLFTGGDPMVMSPETLNSYIEPLISDAGPPHLETIRIGSKSLAWWPYTYTTDAKAKGILQLFEKVVKSGRQLAFQAHFSHPRELEHPVAQEAIRLIRSTGAQIRGQAPLIRHVNDDAETWRRMWNLQVKLGIIPYYM